MKWNANKINNHHDSVFFRCLVSLFTMWVKLNIRIVWHQKRLLNRRWGFECQSNSIIKYDIFRLSVTIAMWQYCSWSMKCRTRKLVWMMKERFPVTKHFSFDFGMINNYAIRYFNEIITKTRVTVSKKSSIGSFPTKAWHTFSHTHTDTFFLDIYYCSPSLALNSIKVCAKFPTKRR